MAETEKQREADTTEKDTTSTNGTDESGEGELPEEETPSIIPEEEEKYEAAVTADEIEFQSTETVELDSSLLNDNDHDSTLGGNHVTLDSEAMDEVESSSPESLGRDLDLTSTGRDVSSTPMTDSDLRELTTEPLILDERESLLEDETDKNELSQKVEKLTVEITEIDKIEVYRDILAIEYLDLEEVAEGKKSLSDIPEEKYSNQPSTTLLEPPSEVPVEAKEVSADSQEMVTIQFLGPPLEGEVKAEREQWNELERQELDIIEHTPDVTEPIYEHTVDQELSDLELARLQQALEKQGQEWKKSQEEIEAQQGGKEEEAEKQENIDFLNSSQLRENGEVALFHEVQVGNESFELGQAAISPQHLLESSQWKGDITQKQVEDLSFQFTEKDLLMTEMASDISLYAQNVNPSEEITSENINGDLLEQVTLTTQDVEARSLDEDTEYRLIDHENLFGELEEPIQGTSQSLEQHLFEETLPKVQFFDSTTDLGSESYEEDLELVTQAPQLPEPPSYDFLGELEEQEEFDRELRHKYRGSLRSHLIHSLGGARFRKQTALTYGRGESEDDSSRPLHAQKMETSELRSGQEEKDKESDLKQEFKFNSMETRLDGQVLSREESDKQATLLYNDLIDVPHNLRVWSHLAHHEEYLRFAGAGVLFDALPPTQEERLIIFETLFNGLWEKAKEKLISYVRVRNLPVDPQIFDIIFTSLTENMLWNVIDPEWTQAFFISRSAWNQQDREEHLNLSGKTVISFSSSDHSMSTLIGAKTHSASFQLLEPKINPSQFRNVSNWIIGFENYIKGMQPDRGLKQVPIPVSQRFPRSKSSQAGVAPNPTHWSYAEKGLWRHLASHLPILERRRTYVYLNRIMKTKQQEETLISAIIDQSWSSAKGLIHQFAKAAHVNIDKEIIGYIVDELSSHIKIRFDESSEGIYTITSQTTGGSKLETKVIFKLDQQLQQVLPRIHTKSSLIPVQEPVLQEWALGNIDYWFQELANLQDPKNLEIYQKQILVYPLSNERKELEIRIGSSKFRSENLYELFDEALAGEYEWTNIEIPRDIKLRIDFFNFSSGARIAGHTKVTVDSRVLASLIPKPTEKQIERMVLHKGVMDCIITSINRDVENSFQYVSSQVRFPDIAKLPKNEDLDIDKFGEPDSANFRKPDIITINIREDDGKTKIVISIIDVKRARSEFGHSIVKNSKYSERGRGWGQPLRDSLGVIHKIKSIFPEVPDDDIEVSCMVLTAKSEQDAHTLMVEGDILFSQQPVSRIFPYIGRVCDSNDQVFRLIRRIRKE
ncbi:MAG: hypothetical protein ACFFE8_13255 [Candidatus Heimdallarchaeota archaeon]